MRLTPQDVLYKRESTPTSAHARAPACSRTTLPTTRALDSDLLHRCSDFRHRLAHMLLRVHILANAPAVAPAVREPHKAPADGSTAQTVGSHRRVLPSSMANLSG